MAHQRSGNTQAVVLSPHPLEIQQFNDPCSRSTALDGLGPPPWHEFGFGVRIHSPLPWDCETPAQESLHRAGDEYRPSIINNPDDGLRVEHEQALRKTSAFYVSAVNTEMALALSEAVGALNQSANPIEYGQFNQIIEEMKKYMDASGTQILELNQAIGQFQTTQKNQPFSWLKGGLDLIQGALGTTPFGFAAGTIRSILANVFDRGQLALQQNSFGLALPNSATQYVDKKMKDLNVKVTDFVKDLQVGTGVDKIADAAQRGVKYYTDMSTILGQLEKVNSKVNYFNGVIENLRVVAQDNQRSVQSKLHSLMNLADLECTPTTSNSKLKSVGSCNDIAAAFAGVTPLEADVRKAVTAYYDQKVIEIKGSSMSAVAGKIQGMSVEIKTIEDDGTTKNNNMVGAFGQLISELIQYLDQGNPFSGKTDDCKPDQSPTNQPSPYCTWRQMTQTPLDNLKQAYNTKRFRGSTK